MKEENSERMGAGGYCICPKCDKRIPHNQGIPCMDEKCPKCGAKMVRENSYHHRRIVDKKAKASKNS